MGGGGESRRVTVRCDRESGCPLYRKDDRLEFDDLMVRGLDFAPVCSRAVAALSPAVERVRAGNAPWHYDGTACGGCAQGDAWFAFSTSVQPRTGVVTPSFESFATAALSAVKALEGVPPAVLRRVVPLIQERTVKPGDVLVRAGERALGLILIVEGRFLVAARGDGGQERSVTTMGRGDCAGAESILTGEASEVTVTAWGAGQVLEVVRRDVPAVLSAVPQLAVNLTRDVLRRRFPGTGAAPSPRGGMAGTLEAILPAELVQAMHAHGHTGRLLLERDGTRATVHFEGGAVVDARIGATAGADALFAILGWVQGDFRFEPGRRAPTRTIQRETMGLLLEGARRLDESSRTSSPL